MGDANRRGSEGILTSWLGEHGREGVCLETCRKFANHLGFHYKTLKKGTFTDEHESEGNKEDRAARYLPQYFDYFEKGPSKTNFGGELVSVDMRIEDTHGNETMEHRKFYSTFVVDGVPRDIDMGGFVDPDGTSDVYLHASHDESCFKAGEQQAGGFLEVGTQCTRDKSEGPSIHYACFVVEYGNGTICLEPWNPKPPLPISLATLRNYIKHKRDAAATGGVVALPRTADVYMMPGKNKDGYWGSDEFWMQTELAMDIFEKVSSYCFLASSDTLLVAGIWKELALQARSESRLEPRTCGETCERFRC